MKYGSYAGSRWSFRLFKTNFLSFLRWSVLLGDKIAAEGENETLRLSLIHLRTGGLDPSPSKYVYIYPKVGNK